MSIALSTIRKTLTEKVSENALRYGEHVLSNRAIPELRDGLKPVQRRILWAMYKMGLNSKSHFVKSARIVGEVLGKFHPHGDMTSYMAMVNMSQPHCTWPTVEGAGNWGDFNSPPASGRYTEVKLQKFTDLVMLDPDYLSVIPLMPNYDGREKEPVYLPAKLPYCFLNHQYGIAYGATTHIPSFELKGLVELTILALQRKLTWKDSLHHLKFEFKNGGKCISPPPEQAIFFKTGKGRLVFKTDLILNMAKKEAYVRELGPGFNYDTFTRKVMDLDCVKSVSETSNSLQPIEILIQFKPNVPEKEIRSQVSVIEGWLTNSVTFFLNFTMRSLDSKQDLKYKFFLQPIHVLIEEWTAYRLELEKAVLNFKIERCKQEIERLDLMILAARNLDKIVKILKARHGKRADMDIALSKILKVTIEQAHEILDLAVHRLSLLEESILKSKIAAKQVEKKDLLLKLKHPEKTLINELNETFKVA